MKPEDCKHCEDGYCHKRYEVAGHSVLYPKCALLGRNPNYPKSPLEHCPDFTPKTEKK